jgi:ribosomal protein S27AE
MGTLTYRPRVVTVAPGPTTVTSTRERACARCGEKVRHTMSGKLPLEREACPACGESNVFTSYERMDIALS